MSRKLSDRELVASLTGVANEFPGQEELINFFLVSLFALLQDSPFDTQKGRAEQMSLIRRLNRIGLMGVLRELSALSDGLMRLHKSSGSALLDQSVFDISKHYPIFREVLEYSRKPTGILLRYLLSFCLLGKKLKIDDPRFNDIAFRDWQSVEEEIDSKPVGDAEANKLSHIIGWLVHPILFKFRRFRFGPGKVSEPWIKDTADKAAAMKPAVHRLLEDVVAAFDSELSRMKLVPKDVLKGYRTIGMEPNLRMYAQQGTADALVRTFKSSPIRHFVDLSDQQINRDCARDGSIDQEYDTLDLSSASDRVSLSLVRRVFPKDLLDELIISRSSEVSTPGGVYTLKKFAPMGSALCFPTQCIIFTAIGLLATLEKYAPAVSNQLAVRRYERGDASEKILDGVLHTHFAVRPVDRHADRKSVV